MTCKDILVISSYFWFMRSLPSSSSLTYILFLFFNLFNSIISLNGSLYKVARCTLANWLSPYYYSWGQREGDENNLFEMKTLLDRIETIPMYIFKASMEPLGSPCTSRRFSLAMLPWYKSAKEKKIQIMEVLKNNTHKYKFQNYKSNQSHFETKPHFLLKRPKPNTQKKTLSYRTS